MCDYKYIIYHKKKSNLYNAVFKWIMSKKMLDRRQCSSSIVFAVLSSPPMRIVFAFLLSQQYHSEVKKTKKNRRQNQKKHKEYKIRSSQPLDRNTCQGETACFARYSLRSPFAVTGPSAVSQLDETMIYAVVVGSGFILKSE